MCETFRRIIAICTFIAALVALVIANGAGAAGGAAGVDVAVTEGQSVTGKVVTGLTCPLSGATITWGDGTGSAGTTDGNAGIQGTHMRTRPAAPMTSPPRSPRATAAAAEAWSRP